MPSYYDAIDRGHDYAVHKSPLGERRFGWTKYKKRQNAGLTARGRTQHKKRQPRWDERGPAE